MLFARWKEWGPGAGCVLPAASVDWSASSPRLEAGPLPGIVRRAASIPETAQGLEGFVNAANALITPALVAMAAVAPLDASSVRARRCSEAGAAW